MKMLSISIFIHRFDLIEIGVGKWHPLCCPCWHRNKCLELKFRLCFLCVRFRSKAWQCLIAIGKNASWLLKFNVLECSMWVKLLFSVFVNILVRLHVGVSVTCVMFVRFRQCQLKRNLKNYLFSFVGNFLNVCVWQLMFVPAVIKKISLECFDQDNEATHCNFIFLKWAIMLICAVAYMWLDIAARLLRGTCLQDLWHFFRHRRGHSRFNGFVCQLWFYLCRRVCVCVFHFNCAVCADVHVYHVVFAILPFICLLVRVSF